MEEGTNFAGVSGMCFVRKLFNAEISENLFRGQDPYKIPSNRCCILLTSMQELILFPILMSTSRVSLTFRLGGK